MPPGVDLDTAKRAYTIASGHWPASRCSGEEQVGLAHGSALWDLVGSNYSVSGPDIQLVAVAAPGTCRVLLNDEITWSASMLCMIAEHEFGHLSGLGHSADPDDVMAPVVRHAPDCEAAFGAPEPAATELLADGNVDGSAITDEMVGATVARQKSAGTWGSTTTFKQKSCRTKVSKYASARAKRAARRCRMLLAKRKALAKKKALARKRAPRTAARP